MDKLTDINVFKSKDAPQVTISLEFDGELELHEIINPVIESPHGIASRLEHLAGMIREYSATQAGG